MRFIVGNVATQVIIGGKDNLLGLDLKEELRQYLRVKVKGANFSPNYGAGKWDGYKYFIAGDKFATGFLPMIIKFVESLGVYVEIDDQRGPIPAMVDPIKDSLGGMIYRPYQREAIVAPAAKWIMGGGDHSSGDLLYWPRGVIDGATNAGKTLIIAGIYDNYNHITKRALVTVHNDKLYKQHFKFFSEFFDVGEVTSKKYDPKDFTLAMSASLANKAKSSLNVQKDLKEFNMLFIDECFTAGTLIDGKPIERYQVGDFVNSFNHRMGTIEKKKVLHTFTNFCKCVCKVTFSNGIELVTTPSHPFFSEKHKKYMPISELLFSFVHYIRQDELQQTRLDRKALYNMRKTCFSYIGGTEDTMEKEQNVLFRCPQSGIYKQEFKGKRRCQLNNIEQNCGKAENDRPQSYEESYLQGKDGTYVTDNETRTKGERGKWKRPYNTSAFVSNCIRVGHGNISRAKRNEKRRIPFLLQTGYRKRDTKDRNRSGRDITSNAQQEDTGQEKRFVIDKVRVENIEIYEQGSGVEFARLCPEGKVYNIEVEDNNNYYVNGVLVHNCHRAAGTDYNQLVQKIDAPVRLFVSGSPLDNPDPIKNMIIMGLSGTSLFKVSKQELTEGGFSSTITVHIYLNNTRLKQFKPTYAEEVENIVQYSEERLIVLLNAIEERIDKRILISYVNIAHGDWLYQAIKDYFPELRVEVTHGSDKQSDEKIEAFKRKEINILLTSMILQEGINIKTIQVLVRTEGGTSTIRTKQLSGRAERKELADGEEEHAEIVDFHDGMFDEIVGVHSRKRIADYKKQGFEVVLHYKAVRNKPTL